MLDEKDIPLIGRSVFTAANLQIHSGPCIVKNVTLAADGANADCQVYDGFDTSAQQKAHLEALSGTTSSWLPGSGTDFEKGIYVVVNASTSKVMVTYVTESRKAFL